MTKVIIENKTTNNTKAHHNQHFNMKDVKPNINVKDSELNAKVKAAGLNIKMKDIKLNINAKDAKLNNNVKDAKQNVKAKSVRLNTNTKDAKLKVHLKNAKLNWSPSISPGGLWCRTMPNRRGRRKSSDNLMLQTHPNLNQSNSQLACTHTNNFGDKKNPEMEKKTHGQAEDIATVRTPCVKKLGNLAGSGGRLTTTRSTPPGTREAPSEIAPKPGQDRAPSRPSPAK